MRMISLFPGEQLPCSQGNSRSRSLTAFSRSSAERMRWSHPAESKRRSHMNTERRDLTNVEGELTPDELEQVSGGESTTGAIIRGLEMLPVVGVAVQMGLMLRHVLTPAAPKSPLPL